MPPLHTCVYPSSQGAQVSQPLCLPQARPVIRAVTRAALEAWAADTSSPLPAFEPHDAVIQVDMMI